MSATRAATERNIRLLMDDLNPDDYAVSSARLHHAVESQMNLLATRTVLPMEAVTDVALVAGIYDYTLNAISGWGYDWGSDWGGSPRPIIGDVRQVLLNADGRTLKQLSLDEINRAYYQDTSA